jgi:hypothetical protein
MTTVKEESKDPWALETGLPNDVDGWMANCRFGTKEEYAQAVKLTVQDVEAQGVAGLMFMADLFDDNNELIGTQGWSVGSGWIPSGDGKEMHHPARGNVVNSSRYGQLQTRVIKDLQVNMRELGVPTVAATWNGLGFHWMIEEHATIKGKEPKQGLMPTIYLGRKTSMDVKAPAAAATSAPAKASVLTEEVDKQLKHLAEVSPNAAVFQKAALKIEAVTKNDDLMATILDEGPNGYYEQNKPK